MTYWRAGGLLAIVLADLACFDSDQTIGQATTTNATTGDVTTTSATTTSDTTETGSSSTTGTGKTCRDAIDCVFMCAAIIQGQLSDPDYEPDLSCFLECEEQLSVDEVYLLLKLANCTALVCRDLGECAAPSDSSSSSGSESSSSSDGSSSGSSSSSESSSSSGEGDPPLIDPCLQCVFERMLDPESPGCEEFAMQCQ